MSSNDEKCRTVDYIENARGIDKEPGYVTKRKIQESNRTENKKENNGR